MIMNLIPLEGLKANSPGLGALIPCTESDVQGLSTECLLTLKQQLDLRPQSRDTVTSTVVLLWTASHMFFLNENALHGQQVCEFQK